MASNATESCESGHDHETVPETKDSAETVPVVYEDHETVPENAEAVPEVYEDYILCGRTGLGKSTTGNKLLGIGEPNFSCRSSNSQYVFKQWTSKTQGLLKRSPTIKFAEEEGGNIQSVTDQCEMISNENLKIRVLDMPGFSDTRNSPSGITSITYQSNLGLVRTLVRIQFEQKMSIFRFVYFLPDRGPLEKTHSVLKDELNIINHYFGEKVFDNMVVVATQHKKYQAVQFDENDIKQNEDVFLNAMESVIGQGKDTELKCPPIVYIALEDTNTEIRQKFKGARVISPDKFKLELRDDICSKCAATIHYTKQVVHESKDIKPQCICVETSDGVVVNYQDSKCHPLFIPKYSKFEKIVGGFAHVVTLGIGKAVMHKPWPSFFNSQEVCVSCGKAPGESEAGCKPVHSRVVYTKAGNNRSYPLITEHTNEIAQFAQVSRSGTAKFKVT